MRTRTWVLRLMAVIAVLAMVASACTSDSGDDTTTTAAPATTTTSAPTTTSADGGTTAAPTTTAAPSTGLEGVFKTALVADLTTNNYWQFLDTETTAHNSYVLGGGSATSLWTLSAPDFLLVPALAVGLPTATTQEGDLWVVEVPIRQGMTWSDGEEITADDMAFTFRTVRDFGLGGNWAANYPTEVENVEAVDAYTVKLSFNTETAPGLAFYQNGVGLGSILPEHFYGGTVEAAAGTEDPAATLYAADGAGAPAAGAVVFNNWEPGAFASVKGNPDYYYRGVTYTVYSDLSFRQAGAGIDEVYYGSGGGEVLSEWTDGPFVDEVIYSEYGSQDAAYLAFVEGEVDYVWNPSGVPTGRRDQLLAEPDIDFAINPSEGFRYLAFNLRKAPMNDQAFREALAYVIDKEFVTNSVLGGAAVPIYSLIPQANAAWYTDEVNKWGLGMSEGERFDKALEVLKAAGYTWSTEPVAQTDADGNYTGAFTDGQGMTQPDGTAVPTLELQAPGPGYDPLRSTFATWIGLWGDRLGIPIDVNPTDFNTIVDAVFPPQTEESVLEWDMYMLGWGGGDPSLPCSSHDAFFSADQDAVTGGGFNTPGYNNADFESLIADFNAATDIETAKVSCREIEKNISENLPYIVLFSTPITDAFRDTLQFGYTDVLGGLNGIFNPVGNVKFAE